MGRCPRDRPSPKRPSPRSAASARRRSLPATTTSCRWSAGSGGRASPTSAVRSGARIGSEWTRQPVAQLRHEPSDHHWRLYCTDRNSRWHYYDMVEATPQLDELLDEIDRDPTGIFWG